MEVLCMDWQSGVEDFKWKYINHRHGEIIGRDAWLDPISLTVMEYSEGKIIIKKAKNNEEFSTLLDGFGKEFKIKFYSRNTLREYFKIHFENTLKKEVTK